VLGWRLLMCVVRVEAIDVWAITLERPAGARTQRARASRVCQGAETR